MAPERGPTAKDVAQLVRGLKKSEAAPAIEAVLDLLESSKPLTRKFAYRLEALSAPEGRRPTVSVAESLMDASQEQEYAVLEVLTTDKMPKEDLLINLTNLYKVRFEDYESTRALFEKVKLLARTAQVTLTIEESPLVSFTLSASSTSVAQYKWRTANMKSTGLPEKSSVGFPAIGIDD